MGIKQKLKSNKLIYLMYTKFINSNHYKKIKLNKIDKYYKNRFKKYSGAFNNSKMSDLSYITWLYHVIEKGLSMPNMKPGFGKEKIIELISRVRKFIKDYSDKENMIEAAISTIFEYYEVHHRQNLKIDGEVENEILKLKNEYGDITPLKQEELKREAILKGCRLSFEEFSYFRHSIRNFDSKKEVSIETLISSINVAKNAPSACNRQHSRVYVISNKDKIAKCLSLQSGNRGFGHLVNKLLIVTGDLRAILGPEEFYDLNTNVGIFIMNLVYSLFYNEIGTCILNWYALPKQDIILRKVVGIPDYENVVAFIACGYLPDSLKVARFPRLNNDEICKIIE